MIFRKVSDLKREKELAEKRKNDPALNQSQDHLVRKLFSKFKKTNTSSDMSALVPMRDPERGDRTPSPSISRNNSVSMLFPPKVPEVIENGNHHTSSNNAKPPTSSILNVNKGTNKVNSELTTLTETSEKPGPASQPLPLTLIKSKPLTSLANGPRGWGRLKAKTNNEQIKTNENVPLPSQPNTTIDETPEAIPAPCPNTSKETEPPSSSSTSSEPVTKQPIFTIPKLSLSSDSETVGGCEPPGPGLVLPLHPPEYNQMISNLMDFKVKGKTFYKSLYYPSLLALCCVWSNTQYITLLCHSDSDIKQRKIYIKTLFGSSF